MKKILKLLVLSLMVICSFTINLSSVNAYYSCGTSTRCADVKLNYNEGSYVASGSVYFSKGETIYFAWDNDSPGIMQVAFYIVKGTKIVSKQKFAASLGNDYDFYTAEESGYYYLMGACEGGNDTRCQGGGFLKKW